MVSDRQIDGGIVSMWSKATCDTVVTGVLLNKQGWKALTIGKMFDQCTSQSKVAAVLPHLCRLCHAWFWFTGELLIFFFFFFKVNAMAMISIPAEQKKKVSQINAILMVYFQYFLFKKIIQCLQAHLSSLWKTPVENHLSLRAIWLACFPARISSNTTNEPWRVWNEREK